MLVLIQLFGGNDGLNTVIPLDQYEALSAVRPNILIPESKLLPVANDLAFHPALAQLSKMSQNGGISVLQNVGYESDNRSHFRSSDIWATGTDAETVKTSGWLGRYFDGELPNFPVGYPNEEHKHPTAISIGTLVHPSCEGKVMNFGQTVASPGELELVGGNDNAKLPRDRFGQEMDYLRTIAEQTNSYGVEIDAAYKLGKNVAKYSGDRLSSQLKTVARLIDGGLQTSVYTVRLSGFDTHARQVTDDGSLGTQASLLQSVNDAISSFQEDLASLGHAHRVAGLTYSEFGRRIRSNSSRGTDHGAANSMFLFGECLTQPVLGDNPTIDPNVGQSASLPIQYDFRDIFGSILKEWFSVSDNRVRKILYKDFTYIPLLGNCSAAALPVDLFDLAVTNKGNVAEVSWKTAEEIENSGFEVEVSMDGHQFSFAKWVPSQNSNEDEGIRSYETVDGPLSVGQTYYYRVKAVSFSGESTFSPIKSVTITGAKRDQFTLGSPTPNPASVEVSFVVYSPTDQNVTYSMFDAAGKQTLADSAYLVGRQERTIKVRTGRMPTGTYVLRLTTELGEVLSRRIILRR